MPSLIRKKSGTKTYFYIVENSTEGGIKKRDYLFSLGAIKPTMAKIEFARYLARYRPTKGAITFNIAADCFLDEYVHQVDKSITKGTFNQFKYNAEILRSYFSSYLVDKIDFEAIEAAKKRIAQERGSSNRYINILLSELKKMLTWCHDQGWIASVPKIKRLSETKPTYKIKTLTREEFSFLAGHAPGNLAEYMVWMVHTGLRPAEMTALSWDDVNLDDKTITVRSSNPLKRGRVIPLHNDLIPWITESRSKRPKPSPYERTAGAASAFKRLRSIPAVKEKGIDVSPYVLRKTFGTWLARAGVDSIKLAKIMGHTKLQTTYEFYIGMEHEDLRASIDVI